MIWRTNVRYVSLGHIGQLPDQCNRSRERLSQRGIAPLSRRAGISPGSVSFSTCSTPLSNHAMKHMAPAAALRYKPHPEGLGD